MAFGRVFTIGKGSKIHRAGCDHFVAASYEERPIHQLSTCFFCYPDGAVDSSLPATMFLQKSSAKVLHKSCACPELRFKKAKAFNWCKDCFQVTYLGPP